MNPILVISDNKERSRVIFDNINFSDRVFFHDMYRNQHFISSFELIVVDVANNDSFAIALLRRILSMVRNNDAGLLLLGHGNANKFEVQARIINATEAISVSTLPPIMAAKVIEVWKSKGQASANIAVKLAVEAKQFLIDAFFAGATITPEIATTGTELITRAIAKSGVRDWVSAVQQFDNATYQHCLLVAGLGATFANSMGFGRTQNFRLTKAALLHDVGKTQIPLTILNKPGALTPAELSIVRTHPVKGFEILDGRFSLEMLQVVRSHHEMLDGSGYPDGLQDHQIPDLVRLVTICDIFGALIERRPYKPPMPAAQAYSILVDMSGRLDPELVKAFKPVAEAMI